MRKLNFLLNTLSYLSFRQIYFLIFNKLIKGKLNSIFVYFFIKLTAEPIYIHFDDIKKKQSELFGNDNIWETSITKSNKEIQYYTELKHNIKAFLGNNNPNIFINFWNFPAEDVEINYNYQRFYLFSEAFEELKVPAEKRIELIITWIENNKNKKLAWMGFNCALRLINWLRIIRDVEIENISEEQWKIIGTSIYQQNEFNKKNIEHHIPGNHVLVQYYSLWLISVLFEEWFEPKFTEKWLIKLIDEFDKEFLKKGLHFELSTHYHLQITLVGLYLISHLRNLDYPIPEVLGDVVNKAVGVIKKFMIGKYYPLIGDGCYCFFHQNVNEDLSNFNYLLNKLKIPQTKLERISNLDDVYISLDSNTFKTIFDIGEIGLKQNSGHGHADTLSFILGYKNIPIFIDPGTRRYSNNKIDLELKRSLSHNTVNVGHFDQATLWGFFRWAYLPENIRYKHEVISANECLLEGAFEGFHELGGIKHKRKILVGENEIIIDDKINGKIKNFVEINFILHPEIKVYEQSGTIILESKDNKFIIEEHVDRSLTKEIKEQLIYDGYDFPIKSNKIIFRSEQPNTDSFKSKIMFRVLN